MGSLSKYEQETVINFNAGEQTAVVYTRDKAVMRKLDALVIAFPEVYKLVGETDIDKTYFMPKSCVSYRMKSAKKGIQNGQLELYVEDVFSVSLVGATFPSLSFSFSS